jgi:hypothetical protein
MSEMPHTIFAHKAKPVLETETPTTMITVGPVIMPTFETIPQYDMVFEADAQEIEAALYNSLPGGTYDRLLGLMLRRVSCHFIVSHRA